MRTSSQLPFGVRRLAAGIGVALVVANAAAAADGVVEINQTRATAGSITAGDGPGFPVTISESGSYRLTGNLVNPDANTRTIDVTSNDVTIDLGGFSIIGPVTCTGAASNLTCSNTGSAEGIAAYAVRQTTVVNGTIRGAGLDGLALGSGCRVEGVSAVNNGRHGISVRDYSTVLGSNARSNGDRGVLGSSQAIIERVVSAENKTYGIVTGSSSTIRASVATNNGIDGISAGPGAGSVIASVATNNEGSGIRALNGAVVADNSTFSNGGDGIYAGTGSTVSRNASYNNLGDQIEAVGSSLIGNSVRSTTSQGWGLQLTGSIPSGYGQNTISASGAAGTVTGGTSMGDNVCNGVGC